MVAIEFFPSTTDLFEAEISSLSNKLYDMAMSEIADLLDDWNGRFPRHRFRIGSPDGLFWVEISPPLHALTEGYRRDPAWARIDHIPAKRRRGAIGQLAEEIDAASAAWVKIEARVGTPMFGWVEQQEPRHE